MYSNGRSDEPPRKKSKWDDLAQEEDEAAEKEKKRQKKAQQLQIKLAKEREVLLGTASREPTPSSSSGGRAVGSPRPGAVMRKEKGVRRTRDMHPLLESCRSVYCYERLNHIEEGSYGIVFRARCKETGAIVALKKLKMDKEKNGFPITSLREIQTLMVAAHENIVRVREIVVGDTLTQVFIVMDFIEHDLKQLLSSMPTPFLASEIKTLLLQLLSAMALCHDNWIVHRDLKTSNLLMNNRGQIKVADFGLARTYGEPLGDMTQLVVTLWYRAPELLLGATEYTTAVDMWSIGCIFGELILKEPLLPGKGEIDQVSKIFKLLGRPTEEMWPGFSKLPNAKNFNIQAAQPYSTLRQTFKYLSEQGLDLLSQLLAYDPEKRISAEEALKHPYFTESPLPKHSDLFSSFPSVAAGEKKSVFASPSAPAREDNNQYDLV
ncbi:cell division cycle 2-like protein [Pseudohyphozyma bogoriensis]|nr:cell division cycle 2-like protein [Pseudohyphozyma bogoriensis]